MNNVIANLTLTAAGVSGQTGITWTSSDEAVVDTTGTVVRPSFTAGDKTVKLTATVASASVPTVKTTKVFNVVVKKAAATAAELVAIDKAALSLGDLSNVTANLTLPATTTNGSTITWASADTAIVANNGNVVRPSGSNVTVKLTATINNAGTTDTKDFYVTVVKN